MKPTRRKAKPEQIRLAVVSIGSPGGEWGGVERFYLGLVKALQDRGFDAQQVDVPGFYANFDDLLKTCVRCHDLDLSEFDGVISTKSPGYLLRHRNHVCYLPHTMRIFYDRFENHENDSALEIQRRLINLLDSIALRSPALKGLFCVGNEVRQRLLKFINVDSEVLYHPSTMRTAPCREGQYLFLPGRLHEWKRIDLAINAVASMEQPYPLVISGTGPQQERLKEMANDLPHVSFVGHCDETHLADLYAGALAILFPAVEEDYGLVTIESFASAKPVVTCVDSGEPARLVSHGFNGFVCEPTAVDMARYLDWLVANPENAMIMGENGPSVAEEISWTTVCDRLLARLGYEVPGP